MQGFYESKETDIDILAKVSSELTAISSGILN